MGTYVDIIEIHPHNMYWTEDNQFTLIHEEAGLDQDSDSYLSHHFHLHHGDSVEVKVTATNNAEKSSSATSDGYIVDLTEPSMLALVDGKDVARDIHYTVSVTQLPLYMYMYVSLPDRYE